MATKQYNHFIFVIWNFFVSETMKEEKREKNTEIAFFVLTNTTADVVFRMEYFLFHTLFYLLTSLNYSSTLSSLTTKFRLIFKSLIESNLQKIYFFHEPST